MRQRPALRGFTLVELAIVLVIIGLIIGGVLVGRDLISQASIRAQISQLQQFDAAVRTFNVKYGGLPGDLSLSKANTFGFYTTGCLGGIGRRDGNDIIQTGNNEYLLFYSEPGMFWMDLSQSGLIGGTFLNGGAIPNSTCMSTTPTLSLAQGSTYVGDYIPAARIGGGNFVYVTYANPTLIGAANNAQNVSSGLNYYTISAVTDNIPGSCAHSNPGLSVLQASSIDIKMDDGLPTSGSVIAQYINCATTYWTNASVSDTSSSCYNTTNGKYSTSINQGGGINCGLSVRLQ